VYALNVLKYAAEEIFRNFADVVRKNGAQKGKNVYFHLQQWFLMEKNCCMSVLFM
jgi:hypothetical protein